MEGVLLDTCFKHWTQGLSADCILPSILTTRRILIAEQKTNPVCSDTEHSLVTRKKKTVVSTLNPPLPPPPKNTNKQKAMPDQLVTRIFFFSLHFVRLYCFVPYIYIFHKDGYDSSIVWLSTTQIYVSIKVDITTIFDS